MPFRTLRQDAMEGKLTHSTTVWREGDEQDYPAGEIVGLLPNSQPKKEEDPGPKSSLGNDDPYATPKAERTIADGPPGGLYLPYLKDVSFPLLFLFVLLCAGLGYAGLVEEDPPTSSIYYSFSALSGLLWFFFSIVYLHRAWEMMRILGAPMSGTKAVSILLIPFFNAIWAFAAIFGWAKLWNFNVKRHPGLSEAHSVWIPVFLLFCIEVLMTQVIALMLILGREIPDDFSNPSHQFALATFAATLLLSLITWFQICRSINFLARKKS